MKKQLIAIVFTMGSLAACGGSDTPAHAVPEGNWALTLAWTNVGQPGSCAGLPATYLINFDISDGAGGAFILTPGTGLTGDTLGGTMTCVPAVDPDTCTLDFTDMGAGGPASNVTTQTIHANIVEDAADQLTGTGTATFDLDDGTSCTNDANGTGDVI
jgi:hypothetical protein